MSALFNDPVVIEVTDTDDGQAQYELTLHGVRQYEVAPHDQIQARLVRYLMRAGRAEGSLGAVVLTSASLPPSVKDLAFLVVTEDVPRDARQTATEYGPVEIDKAEVRRFERLSAEFKRKHPRSYPGGEPLEVYDRSVVDMVQDAQPEEWEDVLDRRDSRMAEQHGMTDEELEAHENRKQENAEWGHLTPAVSRGAHAAPLDPGPFTDVVPVQGEFDPAGPLREGVGIARDLQVPEDRRPRPTQEPIAATPHKITRVSDDDLAQLNHIPVPAPLAPTPGHRRVADMESLMERGKHSENAREGWRGTLNTLGMTLPPDAAEQRRRSYRAAIRPEWPGTPVVTYVNEKGSGGKTPGALMGAAVLKKYGPGDVAVVDFNPSGNAHKRAEWEAPLGKHPNGKPFTVRDLGQTYKTHGSLDATTVGKFLHRHTTDLYGLLSRHVPLHDDDEMTAAHVGGALDALSPYMRAIVVDTGNQPWDRVSREILSRTTQLVVPVLTYEDREEGAKETLELMEDRGGHYAALVSNAVMKINVVEPTRAHKRKADEWKERWSDVVREVVVVPFDAHMASTSLRFEDLAMATREAELHVAAAVAEGFRAA